MDNFLLTRLVSSIKKAISRLNLNLKGLKIVTECATGIYACTPVIALLAGVKKVVTYGRDSKFGKFYSAKEDVITLLQNLNAPSLNLIITNNQKELIDHIKDADIITNSGHLRPLDRHKLENMKVNAVIPLMYEAWEFRETDIDISFCKEKSIKVAGTNERHPNVGVFDYLGTLVVKALIDTGMEIVNNKYLLICDNDFKEYIAKTLLSMGAEVQFYPTRDLVGLDGIIFAHTPAICGGKLKINYDYLPKEVPICLQLFGDVNRNFFNTKWIPKVEPDEGHMGLYLSDLGVETVVRLQAGGLKVAELLFADKTTLNGIELVQIL